MNTSYLSELRLNRTRIFHILFVIFLISIPFSVRKVLWFLPLRENFNEYTDISFYFSDISFFILALFVLFNIKLKHNIVNKSTIRGCFTWNKLQKIDFSIFLIIILFTWSLISLFWIKSIPVGLYSILKFSEMILLFLIINLVPRETIFEKISWIQIGSIPKTFFITIISLGCFESFLAITQFLHQQSIGLTLLKESIFNINTPGVAKILFNNHVYIRAYGSFPHPNILGGFLLFSIITTKLYCRLFHVEQSRRIFLILQYIGIFITFSKSAILGLIIATLFIHLRFQKRTSDSIATIQSQMFHVKHILIILFSIFSGLFLYYINLEKFFIQSLQERWLYMKIAFLFIHNHPILGISCGQFVFLMEKNAIYPLLSWQLQPVHNVFLLIWSELGFIGFFTFSIFFIHLLTFKNTNVSRGTNDMNSEELRSAREISIAIEYFRSILLGFFIILLFDHYLWDIQQGQWFLWMTLGIYSMLTNLKDHKSDI